ncbi:anti-virulence regulator CigR family protein [Zwartia sp.]|uniref:anti-virulence regulator CigR family protein n=1 Tax=Zwartia sp. TaxID=2978004 RepID=UPI0027197EFC|nr:anti-virulence regulator CigR family protein [Zwartia sp.]MDO9024507.1 anti-virulence regulator CigR family protein [Zwartia sp.]
MKLNPRTMGLAFALALAVSQPAIADPPPGKGNPNKSSQGNSGNNGNNGNNGQGKGKGQGQDQNQGNSQIGSSDLTVGLVSAGITALTVRNLATSYGNIGYSPLPPGIAKNLARGKPLPPGIAKKLGPGPLLNQLPYYPGYEWQVAGSDLILVAVGTLLVADILKNVFQ